MHDNHDDMMPSIWTLWTLKHSEVAAGSNSLANTGKILSPIFQLAQGFAGTDLLTYTGFDDVQLAS